MEIKACFKFGKEELYTDKTIHTFLPDTQHHKGKSPDTEESSAAKELATQGRGPEFLFSAPYYSWA